MIRQNRVTPFGTIVADAARGTLLGNRGILHDAEGSIRRAWAGKAWICCALAFKGRRIPLAGPGHYTALFFLDEATALAAGHRPCAECRRAAFTAFRDAWARGTGWPADAAPPRATEIDARLHAERVRSPGRVKLVHRAAPGGLPDGTMVVTDDEPALPLLVWSGALHPWSPAGYGEPRPLLAAQDVNVLTPPSTVAALSAGYTVSGPEKTSGL
ncbi:hypothetical protein HL658_12235 [Azospirillum sp. RWY-5-1]|uniref:Ada DNA repair metal-binding domain-containing protein n=1 Tax=Azospirillum oleiclasticum TaxID=2735135 RepID=A0ABX2TBD8_9PROT|nr:hypothetical protein [Azospirillum oleiclasticum]NYZ13322.1 hypothetical protein [Azospirillum oleiclasticum]NYZ20483.1 hypothetical protein [Azospirillum oleiclasticum]